MTFFVYQESNFLTVFPASYRQDGLGLFEQSIFQKNEVWKWSPRQQREHTIFANSMAP